jgi:hypothetical protein
MDAELSIKIVKGMTVVGLLGVLASNAGVAFIGYGIAWVVSEVAHQ